MIPLVRAIIKQGDIFEEAVDVLISTANPQLSMSGGINGEILCRGGLDVQAELREYQKQVGREFVEPATVVVTGPGPLKNVGHIVHAVAIDVWYHSSPDMVAQTITNALNAAAGLGARRVALPGLAMGYGHLPAAEFGRGLAMALRRDYAGIEELRVVLRKAEAVEAVRRELAQAGAT